VAAQAKPKAQLGMDDDTLIAGRADPSGLLHLDALRPVALRAGRLAEALFGAMEADVVIVQTGAVWRGKPKSPLQNDVDAAEIAMLGEEFFWLEDTHLDAQWRDHPQVQGPNGVRLCASAPIVPKTGGRLGALRVFDNKPRAFDLDLANRLKDLAAAVAEECDRLVSYERRVLREIFEQSPGFAAVFDGPTSIHQMVNPAYIALVGPRPMIGMPGREALPELTAQGFFDRVEDVYKTGRPFVGQGDRLVIERTPGDFEEVYLDFVLQPIVDAKGDVSSISLQGVDVTQERRSVEALNASQIALKDALAATQAIFDHSLDVICTIDRDGLFTQVSRHAVSVWGYTAQELIGRPFIDFVHPDDRALTLATDKQIVVDGIPTSSFRNRYIHKNGSIIPIAWSSVWSPQHRTLFCVARDMRESLAGEEKLRQAQKMEAVGRLTGGVAHDFNNLLTVIIGAAETLVYENKAVPAVTELAEMIRAAGERGSGLTSQLLAFARRQPLNPRSVHVTDLLTGMEGLLRRTLGEDIELLVARNDAAWRATADPAQLELAVLNLAINARDAMPSGGKLTIEASNVTVDRAYSQANEGIAVGDYLIVAVTDSGEGMSPETVQQAFEPFFTTKPTGQGTGLGLSMVQGFVRQSEGNVKIYSELGVGTTIRLYLPRADKEETAATPMADTTGLPRGSEHILLVEDEDLLREHARRQLVSLGYRVTIAASGPKALELIETLGDFDLLFTDVVMPDGLNGRQLADRVRAQKPGLKVLYTSGYSENAIAHQGRLDADVDLLSKPYRKRELALKVRNVLDGDA
jgi:PAS domain S-box-containing protein